MAGTQKKSFFRSGMFQKDPDVLPFFSLHPKTKVGSIIRIASLVVFFLFLIALLMMRFGLAFIWLNKFNIIFLLSLPVVFILLLAVGLFKRMKSMFSKIAIPGLLIFLSVSIVMTFASAAFYQAGLSLSPKLMMENDGHVIVLMRACANPEGTVMEYDDEGRLIKSSYPVEADAYRYTVRVPESRENVSFTIEGEIRIPSASTVEFEIKEEWVDDNTFRLYIAKDTSGIGSGEILVKFSEGETTPASEPASSAMTFRREFEEHNGHRIYLYRENSAIQTYSSSPLMMNEDDFRQVFVAYPRKMFVFADINCRVEGEIVLEPKGVLSGLMWTWNEDRTVAMIQPSPDCRDASGEIILWFDETAEKPATWGEATPAEATPTEATPAEATPAEASYSEETDA